MTMASPQAAGLEPGIPGFSFADLQDPRRLKDLHDHFCRQVASDDPALWDEWEAYSADRAAVLPAPAVSALLVRMAAHVGRFVSRLFRIEEECLALAAATRRHDPLFRFKVEVVRRRALPLRKGAPPAASPGVPPAAVPAIASDEDERFVAGIVGGAADLELALAEAACARLDREAALENDGATEERSSVRAELDALARWTAAHLDDPRCAHWVSFHLPQALEPLRLVAVEHPDLSLPELGVGPEHHRRRRDGFGLTDARMDPRGVLSEIHYCVLCHERDKDSCSKGLRARDGSLARNALGIPLAGCPLDEKISEMHMLRKSGDALGALALVTLDNPMCAGTGHRICNDCMKACIYQKQEPVNIPQAETGVLTDVLRLPWGVEIYSLLSRWNPLNVRRPYPLPYNGVNILIVGLGPAGYTLSHYLLNEGFGVVGVDGLKIEPLPAEWVGGPGLAPRPIRDWSSIYRALDARVLEGFGGVSEYGITVRWDKNFLTLLHLLLSRRERFRVYGGVRFGGTLPIEDAWAYGFSHVAIAAGAGRPTIIGMKNNLIRGVRMASDFLMALQLTGAFKRESLANLQVRLPALVVGGGLTAIDTATELVAYYPEQVEKLASRYEALSALVGAGRVRSAYDAEELAQLDEFLHHAAAIRAERARASSAGEAPDFAPLVRSWGGVSVVYRKRMVDSPAYRLNHEEIVKALEEGIGFIENLDPVEAVPDENGHVKAVVFRRTAEPVAPAAVPAEVTPASDVARASRPAGTTTLPARALLVAAGTSPNVTSEREAPGTFQLDDQGRYFRPHRVVRGPDGSRRLEPDALGFFTSYETGGRFVSYYGDNHPRYAGNVVKAMASARDGFPHVAALFDVSAADAAEQERRERAWERLVARLDDALTARVVDVRRLTPTIIEVVVRAPAAARHFHPGQFYRLQNFESTAATARIDGREVRLVMEGVALTGAWVDRERGLLSMIALELGVSSRLCAYLEPGLEVVVMGPTGAPTEIPRGEDVLLAGGGLGNAVLFSIARALRERGNRVVYFAGYKKGDDLFKREEIEAATDQVIWSTDTGEPIGPSRPQDVHFRGNIVDCLVAYAKGELGRQLVPLQSVDRMIVIGSDRMMAAVKAARGATLAPFLKRGHVAIASINSPMQCMMKEVCAQCLQRHVDPDTGRETIIFSCFNQDQLMDRVDFFNLNARLRQNTVQEKLTNQWLEQVLAGSGLSHV
jgi:NADPH-dependent glutamate synthase beta subunit-like oxidoreductase/NAD(P)H-flavin reductase